MQLTISDDGSEQAIDATEPIDIDLPEKPTTGYRWFLADDSPFELVEERPDVQPSPPGRGGVRHIRLRALRTGRLQLRLVERRRWEQHPSREFVATIVVT
jgi:inhibitor of cysteine peptidase